MHLLHRTGRREYSWGIPVYTTITDSPVHKTVNLKLCTCILYCINLLVNSKTTQSVVKIVCELHLTPATAACGVHAFSSILTYNIFIKFFIESTLADLKQK